MLAFYSRRIEVDPQDAYAYSSRASYYDCLHDREKAKADMRRWSAILSGESSCDLQVVKVPNNRRILNGPFGYQLVFSVEERDNDMQVPCIALGQKKKGRCNMKSFQMPMLSMSLLGLCLLSGLGTPPAYADFTFGEPVKLESGIPVIDPLYGSPYCFSYDGLEMYVVSDRPGGYGDYDILVSRRTTIDSNWGPLENLGPAINTPNVDGPPSISGDGLTLYFQDERSGGYGESDIWMTTRPTKDDLWGQPINLGPKVNSPSYDNCPWISPDNLELYFSSW